MVMVVAITCLGYCYLFQVRFYSGFLAFFCVFRSRMVGKKKSRMKMVDFHR